jgi:MscS family membrane protein
LENINKFFKLFEIEILGINIGRFVLFFIIVLLFQILRRLFVKIIINTLHKLSKKTKNKLDDHLIDIVDKPLRTVVTLIGFTIGFNILNLPDNINHFVVLIMKTLFIFCFFWILYRAEEIINNFFINKFANNSEMLRGILPLLSKTTKVAIIIICITIVIQLWGYDIGAIITGLGIGGLAVALAAKDTLANFFGSLTIMVDRPFKIGDWIICAGIEGTVEDIGFRTTKIRTFSKALVSVPNYKITTDSTINWSMRDRRRIKYSIGATYSTSRKQMVEAVNSIRNMLIEHERIHNEGLMVYFDDFGESSLNIFVYCFTKTAVWSEYLEIRQDVNLKIMEIFENLNIEFAFPSMSIYLENEDSSLP